MGAPKENQFWRKRTKHGRDKLFKTPQILWEAACEYFKWVDDNPIMVWEQRRMGFRKGPGRKPDRLQAIPMQRPYTMGAFCIFIDVGPRYFWEFEATNQRVINDETSTPEAKELAKGFSTVIDAIVNATKEQKFSGASVGIFNAQLIARDLGLIDRKEMEHKGLPEQKTTYVLQMPKDDDD